VSKVEAGRRQVIGVALKNKMRESWGEKSRRRERSTSKTFLNPVQKKVEGLNATGKGTGFRLVLHSRVGSLNKGGERDEPKKKKASKKGRKKEVEKACSLGTK